MWAEQQNKKDASHWPVPKNINGRGSKTRTRDTWFWRPVLYQLSYAPKNETIIAHLLAAQKRKLFSPGCLFILIVVRVSRKRDFWVS